jgi:hypothetical protein
VHLAGVDRRGCFGNYYLQFDEGSRVRLESIQTMLRTKVMPYACVIYMQGVVSNDDLHPANQIGGLVRHGFTSRT